MERLEAGLFDCYLSTDPRPHEWRGVVESVVEASDEYLGSKVMAHGIPFQVRLLDEKLWVECPVLLNIGISVHAYADWPGDEEMNHGAKVFKEGTNCIVKFQKVENGVQATIRLFLTPSAINDIKRIVERRQPPEVRPELWESLCASKRVQAVNQLANLLHLSCVGKFTIRWQVRHSF